MNKKILVFNYYQLLFELHNNKKIDLETLNILLQHFDKIKEIIKKSIDF